ncbi:DNA polymerase III epsilon subunit-like 3'-5' exonuclease [Hoeflea sp. IMCC20628]|uniref:exonuclease domain-containing protein n=1 Tax=Hoeflea sp. IMCC20628 TaxID=1620421 RepID=UPI00063AE195|nr:exonuclease domain-containing protein [Hoeflea sp. IMCC20628]AKI03194.1 DNA polymerase III epsilon subunit-like 3'-5' exonuclease [Hoeflea sp. IMCC20628]
MNLNFAVVDVETANENFSSICSIGVAKFRAGKLVDEHYTLVNPETYFSNTYIHGIDISHVEDAPKLAEGLTMLSAWLSDDYARTVCHMPFDKTATTRAADKVSMNWDHINWHDSARAVKLAWPEYRQSGYGLKKIAKVLGIEFEHHNALADAKAAGEVLLAAAKIIDESKASLWEQISQDKATRARLNYLKNVTDKPIANPEGEFFGQGVCFTGTLPNMTRKEASAFAAAFGFDIQGSVNSKCNILVIGAIDESKLSEGATKTGKWAKAEARIEKGEELRIMSPKDFEALFA